MATTPSSVSLVTIADGSEIVASDHRNNYSDIQTALNALITILAAGLSGQVLGSSGGTTVGWITPASSPTTELSYVEVTSPVTLANAVEASATTVVTAAAVAFDGSTTVLVEFFAPKVTTGDAGVAKFFLFDGSTSLGEIGEYGVTSATVTGIPVRLARRLTPTAATHTYSIRATDNHTTTAAQVVVGAGAAGNVVPGFIRIAKAA